MAKRPAKKVELPAKWRKKAEARCAERDARLTPARMAAFAELVASDQPLSAYELVALLEKREDRKIAPLTVYRHLDFLMSMGLVHKLESKQSFLPCAIGEHSHDSQYLVCSECGKTDELGSDNVAKLLSEIAAERAFTPSSAVVELTGHCSDCSANKVG
ncbi:MAG: Fur family transcriptional regulator [Gammaproteobacteria bacterium]